MGVEFGHTLIQQDYPALVCTFRGDFPFPDRIHKTPESYLWNLKLSRSGIAVFDALVSCKLRGRRPLYICTGRGVTDPLTGLDFP
jgi:hypothetical protein